MAAIQLRFNQLTNKFKQSINNIDDILLLTGKVFSADELQIFQPSVRVIVPQFSKCTLIDQQLQFIHKYSMYDYVSFVYTYIHSLDAIKTKTKLVQVRGHFVFVFKD